MRTRLAIVGIVVGLGAHAAYAQSARSGLSGLDAQLSSTGRVGAMAPGTNSQIEAPDAGLPPAAPEARTARPISTSRSSNMDEVAATAAGGQSDGGEEYRRTEGRVAACRVEVARRRQVAPAKVPAGTVTVRFTVEPSGRVRDAEAVSASDTDPEVSACAKRVLTEWVFAKHAGQAITVQRTYRLASQ
jgi:TonB family protein